MEKKCNICGIIKPIENFRKTSNGRGKFGCGAICNNCLKIKNKIYREKNKTIIKEKRDKFYSSEEGRKKQQKYYKKYYENNKERILPILLEKQKKNRDKRNERYRTRYKNDPIFKMRHNIRRSVLKSLQGKQKGKSTEHILGCSIDEFKKYIESKWEPWMNWDNYGKYKKGETNYGWDIDHIVPSSSAMTEGEVFKLNHYTNLRPLCSYINRYIKKNNL
jgi:hypothetical protein